MFIGIATLLSPFGFAGSALAVAPDFDASGDYVVAFEYSGTEYQHDVTLIQDEFGDLTGDGGSPAGVNTYTYDLTSGTVNGNTITFTADYTATPDAVVPQTTMIVEGEIALDGTMSGTWSDNYAGGARDGTWTTTSGAASEILPGLLAAEDFGVVSYDTGMGNLSGYTAGFGLTDATFEGAQSVIVELFAGDTLLQRNTATPQLAIDVIGAQISSPFDVSGTFDYVTDGYWINQREAEYGQSVPATKVVATVTLENGKVVMATNTNLTGDPETIYPIVDESPTITVTIEKFVRGVMATAETANNADFPMTATWDAENIGAGTGMYVLSETNTVAYQAVTAEMTKGADYETKELVNGDVVAAQCVVGKPFALRGYTIGNTRAEAIAATPSMAKPEFTNLQHDKYIIVWNTDCAIPEGEIGGEVVGNDGVLEVTSIELVDTSATANGSFADGWEYVFHITAPTSEPNLAMKFSDWLKTGGGGTIPVASNMRISSLQADNGGATILLTSANVYSTPDLHMTGDLNLVTDGRQVEIIVEVSVPNGTPNGAYTTAYGVQSN
jgi:hypothetical protein